TAPQTTIAGGTVLDPAPPRTRRPPAVAGPPADPPAPRRRLSRAGAEELAAGGSLTLAGLRDRLGISRRYAQAILEALDAQGVTRRVGEERVLRRRGRELAGG